MSRKPSPTRRTRIHRFHKGSCGRKLVGLTCYDFSTARVLSDCELDFLLVGDSASGVIYGYENTGSVCLDEIIYLAAGVVRGAPNSFIIVDLPFGTYEKSDELAVETAIEVIKRTGASAVKLEGGARMACRISAIVRAGVPVMGHIGFTPQTINALGGYKIQGRDNADLIYLDAQAVEQAGAFAVVMEMVTEDLAKTITSEIKIATIGVGAGRYTDGQLLVINDLIGLSEKKITFAPRYASIDNTVASCVKLWRKDVLEGNFPQKDHIPA
ncbi:MAG: 3-methyl-2-oxobutanoate hydroxymethyltransferase [Tropheryma whipplei]|uniref:3-methyl-2-oxobutanoate hydroxymethyltransferase n=1 Tax=Tropheryma whipplei (strain TW08/27) TaxID=218496 RepID=PANB_TROW8|nr:3-methyl-2-oxobutanoate hydroxymethyltransferase [Tropheryma whipplei]Q83HM1.1 RecName: Full=3-methyl-2-oxobutanoate hydroxymethyltransferase; AltName: Full=Ketopantoate hydroxymethyltransferase; Short=KPHMT [Tropheryma whipplei TW08/27]MCO8182622.1 3-methyl-2-oxobutanoate hydroxymethyltransferase [Tropheryma whipplei]CAD67177.1 3-methyl-2-oxobutanoate hydroxymethyltransferase [Tropheryma whipplei TW08/27]